MEKFIDNLLKNHTISELLLIKKEINGMSKDELVQRVENAIIFRQDITDKSYNKQVNLLENETLPNSVKNYLLENGIITMADLLESDIEDTVYTDHWISWCKKYLDMDKTMQRVNKNKLTK